MDTLKTLENHQLKNPDIENIKWQDKAIETLRKSLEPVPTELNNLDWKSGLSPKKERLAQHLSAFSNLSGGGFLVFGVKNDGSLKSITQTEIQAILTNLSNIASQNLNISIQIEHSTMEYGGCSLLFVYIPEQSQKPIYPKKEDIFHSYWRTAGNTRKMSENQVRALISTSMGINFEDRIAKNNLSVSDILQLLNYRKFYELIDKNVPSATDTILSAMKEYQLCRFENEAWNITNLGAILFANDLEDFSGLYGKKIIVRKYVGANNIELELEQIGRYGYAIGFDGLIDFIMLHTQKGEKRDVRRENLQIYPKVAVRELVANAMIHQDFEMTGMNATIEIFCDRLSISNPGSPLIDKNRFIDLPPRSRNEKLAETMRLLRFCEKRGSGVDKVILEIEKEGLPPVRFSESEVHTRAVLFPEQKLSLMSKEDKIQCCYQNACIMHEKNQFITNQSVRDRFKIEKNNSSMISRILSDTLARNLIKHANPENDSKKYVSYIPYYG